MGQEDDGQQEAYAGAGIGPGYQHAPQSVDGRRIGAKPLPRGSIHTPCTCRDEMNDYGLEFQNSDVCCVGEGGDFTEVLGKQWEEAAFVDEEFGDDDPRSFHAIRDPNVNFRYKLYVHFIKEMGLMGRGRVALPLCYMNAVREIWPSESGEYVGFIFKEGK